MKYSLLNYSGKRPNNSYNKTMLELYEYLNECVFLGYMPSKRELQNKFKIRLKESVESVYLNAKLRYELKPNQDVKYKKASILLKIVLSNLDKFNLQLIKYRGVAEKGIDILTKNNCGLIGIELKAYNGHESIKNKDIYQIKKQVVKEKLHRAILITTTDKKSNNLIIPNNISIIFGEELKKLIRLEDARCLEYINKQSCNVDNSLRNIKRKKILNYVYKKYEFEKKKPSYLEILNNFKLDIYSYFNSLFEIYKLLEIPPPLKNMKGHRAVKPDITSINLWKTEFKFYIVQELLSGRKYPSGIELGKHFGISHIWNITKMSELYEEIGIKSYLEREKRTK